jgi:hypothetical protein
MNTIQKYFSFFHLFYFTGVFFFSIYSVNKCEGEFWGEDEFMPNHFGFILDILLCMLIISPLVYIASLLFHLYNGFIKKAIQSILILKIFLLGIGTFLLWLVITFMVGHNGHCDLFWGPADSGFIFLSLSFIIFNYLLISVISTNEILPPNRLFIIFKNKGLRNKP